MFDMYGRLVGDVVVRIAGLKVNVNHWLVRQGLAAPTLYTSMSHREIRTLQAAARASSQGHAGIWPLQGNVGQLDRSLVYRPPKTNPMARNDQGPVLLPKLYRRLSTWEVNHDAGLVTTDFRTHLAAHRDGCFETSDFLQKGVTRATPRFLHEFIGSSGDIAFQADGIVFREKPSTLLGPDGKPVAAWW